MVAYCLFFVFFVFWVKVAYCLAKEKWPNVAYYLNLTYQNWYDPVLVTCSLFAGSSSDRTLEQNIESATATISEVKYLIMLIFISQR